MFSNQHHENSVGAFWAQVDTSLGWITRKDYPDVNPQGFRDIKDFNNMVNHSKNNRVMILGDSFMWGSGVKTHENVPSLLQTWLQDRYDVYNISVGGWGIDQMYLAYQKYKDIIKPNIIILAYIDDDINRVLECYRQVDNLAKPCFSVQADTLAPGTPGSSLQLLLNKIQRECVLFSLIMHHYYLGTDAIPITKCIFSNMIKETKLRNEKFVVIRIPTSDNARSLHLSQFIYDIEEVFGGTEATYLEPLEEITKIPNWTFNLYFYDGHLSLKGNQFLADYIYRHVFKINNLLNPLSINL